MNNTSKCLLRCPVGGDGDMKTVQDGGGREGTELREAEGYREREKSGSALLA